MMSLVGDIVIGCGEEGVILLLVAMWSGVLILRKSYCKTPVKKELNMN